jgi:hypothetical protein
MRCEQIATTEPLNFKFGYHTVCDVAEARREAADMAAMASVMATVRGLT